MGKIVISTNVSLDGVIQDPDGEEGFSRAAGSSSTAARTSKSGARSSYAEALGTAALLLGRRSDEWFAARWASRPASGRTG